MVFRFLLRYLANNEKLVQKLSESYPIQAAARAVANVITKGRSVAQEQDLQRKLNPVQLLALVRKFRDDVKREIKDLERKQK